MNQNISLFHEERNIKIIRLQLRHGAPTTNYEAYNVNAEINKCLIAWIKTPASRWLNI
jgi:hypothetical protein